MKPSQATRELNNECSSGGLRRARRGQALVPVIFVVLILTVMAVTFATTAQRELRTAGNYAAETDRYFAAFGAANYALSSLQMTSNSASTYGVVTPGPDTDNNGWMPIGNAWVKVDAVDTASCININVLTLRQLMQLPVFQNNQTLAQAIVDWRTKPSTSSSAAGASATSSSVSDETDYYAGLTPPYAIKGAAFDTVNELLLVEGMTPAILYGSVAGTPLTPDVVATANINSDAGSGSSPGLGTTSSGGGSGALGARGDKDDRTVDPRQASSSGGAAASPFADYFNNSSIPFAELLTTVSRERNVDVTGTPRININKATSQQLQDGLNITATLAGRIISAPGRGSFKSSADLLSLRGFGRTVVAQFADKVKVSDSQYNTNVININTAPTEVLAMVTGMTPTILQAIVQYRESGQTFQSIDDFYGLQGLSGSGQATAFTAVLPNLTAKSSVYKLRIRVRVPGSQEVYAISALGQLTDYGPQILQWREVPRSPGWSLWMPATVLPAPTGSTATGATQGLGN